MIAMWTLPPIWLWRAATSQATSRGGVDRPTGQSDVPPFVHMANSYGCVYYYERGTATKKKKWLSGSSDTETLILLTNCVHVGHSEAKSWKRRQKIEDPI